MASIQPMSWMSGCLDVWMSGCMDVWMSAGHRLPELTLNAISIITQHHPSKLFPFLHRCWFPGQLPIFIKQFLTESAP